MAAHRTLRDLWAETPILDLAIPAVVLAVWMLFELPIPEGSVRSLVFTSLSSASGIILAAATFVCALFYQSNSRFVLLVRKKHPFALRRNWNHILGSLLATTLAPIVSIVIDAPAEHWAFGIAIVAGALMTVRFARVIYWFDLTLRLADVSERQPERRTVQFRHPQ